MFRVFYQLLTLELLLLRLLFRRRNALLFENLALRQQLALFHAKMKPARADDTTRSFFVALSRVWDDWVSVLVTVKPETVIDWQRRRFKSYWRRISAHAAGGGKPRAFEIRQQIRKIYAENGGSNCTSGQNVPRTSRTPQIRPVGDFVVFGHQAFG